VVGRYGALPGECPAIVRAVAVGHVRWVSGRAMVRLGLETIARNRGAPIVTSARSSRGSEPVVPEVTGLESILQRSRRARPRFRVSSRSSPDVEKFCNGVQPGKGRIQECLKNHEADLSPDCKSWRAKQGH